LLFEVAMRYGLKENGYTRSVPHAPLCGCVEQMPVVSKADCKDVEAANTWSFAPDEVTGLLTVWQSAVDLKYNDCGDLDLAAHYLATHNTTISHRITGECAAQEESFLASKGYAAQKVKWVKIAGKGIYAEPDNEEHTEQIKDGTHTSMSRADFEKVWATSADQILMRLCLHCTKTHRYAYLKRYDENGLPPNVDILDMIKENWKQYENNIAQEDFKLFSTYDDALQDKNHWLSISTNSNGYGFPRSSGPDGNVYDQWNAWGEPVLKNKRKKAYGQSDVAFYVAVPL